MRRPGDPDLLWRYYAERSEQQETLALLVDRAATIIRKAKAEHRGHRNLTRDEKERISDLLTRASGLAEGIRTS